MPKTSSLRSTRVLLCAVVLGAWLSGCARDCVLVVDDATRGFSSPGARAL